MIPILKKKRTTYKPCTFVRLYVCTLRYVYESKNIHVLYVVRYLFELKNKFRRWFNEF